MYSVGKYRSSGRCRSSRSSSRCHIGSGHDAHPGDATATAT